MKFKHGLFFLVFVFTQNGYTQNIQNLKPSPIMITNTHYPRIEVYSEIDKGDPNAANNTWTDPNGKTVYGGKVDYRPHILRKTYLISEEQKTSLLQTPLRWLPYFGLQKENTTLDVYFQAVRNTDRYTLYNMLPEHLNQLLIAKEKDENYPYYSTLLVYEDSYPSSFTVVWLDENTWFVNDVYYSAEGGFSEFMQHAQEDLVMEGDFKDFLRLSPIFQYKLTEGFPSIKLRSLRNTIPLDDVVLAIALSPGMPNTQSYAIQIMGDGSILQQGLKSNKKIDPNKLTDILFEAQKLNWESYLLNEFPKQFIHDKQTLSIAAWKDGRMYHIDNFDVATPAPLILFVEKVQAVLEIKP